MMQPASGSRCVFGFTVMALVFGSSLARGATSTISGLVTDPTGARLPGVAVTATNEATNVDQSTVTNADGVYVLANLPTGQYRLTLQLEGFRRIVKPGIEVHVQDTLGLNFQMALGSVIQSVTVESGAPLIDTRSGALGTVITRNFVENIPLNGRSFQTLIGLAPGVVFTKVTSGFAPGQFSVNGQRPNTNYFSVDGVSANAGLSAGGPLGHSGTGSVPTLTVQGGTNSLVPADAVEEFRIQTSTFAPEFGRTPGAQISIVTRSGGNQVSGSLFEYFRHDALDATDWFTKSRGLSEPPLRQHDFGGVLGGPLRRDRAFFFASYEGLRLRLPQNFIAAVPSVAARQNAPQNVRPYLNAYPLPTGSAFGPNLAEFVSTDPDPSDLDTISGRVDYAVTPSARLFFRYGHSSSTVSQRGAATNSVNALDTSMTNHSSTAALTNAIGSRLAHELRVNYTAGTARSVRRLDDFGGAQPPPPELLFPGGFSEADSSFTIAAAGMPGLRVGPNADNDIRHWNVVDSLSWLAGRHQVKLGADYRLLLPTSRPLRLSRFLSFGSIDGPTGLLSGIVPLLLLSAFEEVPLRVSNWSVFVQDQWQWSPRLSMMVGVRWDVNSPAEGSSERPLRTFENPDGPYPLRLAEPGTPLFDTRHTNIAPRVGAAYTPCDTCGLVLRGGWGRFFDLGVGSVSTVEFPYGRSSRFASVPLPIDSERYSRPEISLVPPYGFLLIPDRALRTPHTDQWNATVERTVGRTSAITVSYVGARGQGLLRNETVIVPDAELTIIRNTATSNYRALQIQFRRRLQQGLQLQAAYTLSEATDIASSDAGPAGVPSAFQDPREDRGPADFDVRHAASLALSYQISGSRWRRLSKVLDGWSLEALASARSALPVNLTATRIATGFRAVLRPDVVPGVDSYLAGPHYPGGRALNRAAFAASTTGRHGTLGRNALRGFPFRQIDLALRRTFPIRSALQLQVGVEVFNVLNTPNFGDPVGDLLSPLFGQSTSMLNRGLGGSGLSSGFTPLYQIGGPRSVQLSLRARF